MAKRPEPRRHFYDDDWSDFEVTKPWEQCTTDEKWRKLAMEFHELHEFRKRHGFGTLPELRKRRRAGKLGKKEAVMLCEAENYAKAAEPMKNRAKGRLLELLRRERYEPVPPEGKQFLAELLDSKYQCFDVQLELRDKRDLMFEKRREKDFEWGIAIANYVKQHGSTEEEAIEKLVSDPVEARKVKRRYKLPPRRQMRGMWPPWSGG